jgi:hypothetical protein
MNHTAVVRGSAPIKESVNYLKNKSADLVVGEVGSALGSGSGNKLMEASLGSALWQVDFYLYSMSIGVRRINWQSGLTFPFALWNPKYKHKDEDVPPNVHEAFYGHTFSAEFIGKASNVSVCNIDLDRPFMSAYAAYDNGNLGRVAIVNLHLWSNDTQPRPHKNVTLTLKASTTSVKVKKLTSLHGGIAKADNITWGGEQWTATNEGKPQSVLNDTVTLPVSGGKVDIPVKDSEAVMVFV